MHSSATRTEKDSLGEMQVPADAYYGAQTARAIQNFPISGIRFDRPFLRAIGIIKQGAAAVNGSLGLLDSSVADAIMQAAGEVIAGKWDDHFPLDIYQTGSGTSTNMNANEVIARRGMELLQQTQEPKKIHPNDHVNKGQSSNDVIPTSIHLALILILRESLVPALQALREELTKKSGEWWNIIKTGRTHMQDATPIRLGQEFLGYAGQCDRAIRRLGYAERELYEVPLGGTAVGTSINTPKEFAHRVCAWIENETGIPLHETDNHFQAQSSLDAVVFASGTVRTAATALMKIANDIRWLASGPRAGIGELEMPAVQPGSSIMPGKVNPVIAEALIQACAQVIGNDVAVGTGNAWGNLELNTMMPLIYRNTAHSASILAAAASSFASRCVGGLRATERGPALVEQGLMLATALAPVLGYDKAAEIAKQAAATGQSIRTVAKTLTQLADEQLLELLNPAHMTEPGD
jgi:fumarate hydratase class II